MLLRHSLTVLIRLTGTMGRRDGLMSLDYQSTATSKFYFSTLHSFLRARGLTFTTDALVDSKTSMNTPEDFHFNEDSSRHTIYKSAVKHVDEMQMTKTKEMLVKYGFSAGTFRQFPDLLLLPAAAMENYLLVMQETGFTEIRPFWLISFPAIARKSLAAIRKSGLINEKENVIENYFTVLDLPKEIRSNILAALPLNPNELTLVALRMLILEHFLAHELNSDTDSCRNLIFRNPRLRHRSYTWISMNIKILLSEYKLNPEKIVRNGTLLQGNPANFRAILTTLPTLCGLPIRQLGIRRPKIILAQVSSLTRIRDLFHQHGIKDEAVGKYPELFTLSPETVAARLKTIDDTPELLPFKSHPRIGRILYYFETVKKRLEYFSSLDISGVSLHILSVDQEKFATYIQRGDLRHKGGDLVQLLAGTLGLPKKQVRTALSVHPHWLQIPPQYAKEVVHFLQKSFTLDQVRSTIPIVLYPLAKVEVAIQQALDENQSNVGIKTHPNFLHLVLYHLEKEFHFTGDGIWTWYHQLRHDKTEKDGEDDLPLS